MRKNINLHKIKIFLASSNELKFERKQIEIFIAKKNKRLMNYNIFLELVLWEDLMHSYNRTRIQDYFNEEMSKCKIIIALFYTKVGLFTKEELNIAYNGMKKNDQPQYILVFFKKPKSRKINLEIRQLQNEIENQEQLYNTFTNTDDLLNQLSSQLELILDASVQIGKKMNNLENIVVNQILDSSKVETVVGSIGYIENFNISK